MIAQVQYPLFDKVWNEPTSSLCYVDQLGNGDYVVFGGYKTQVTPDQIYMSRLDSVGNLLWEKDFGFPFASDGVHKVLKTSINTYLLIGSSEGDTLPGFREYAVWNIDSAGNVLFERYYSSGYENIPSDVIETSDSCFVIAGVMDDPSVMNRALTILKIDRYGNQIWRNRIDSCSDYVPTSLAQVSNGHYVITGRTYVSNITFIAKYFPNGQLESMTYPYGNSPNSAGFPIKVFPCIDSAFSVFYSVAYYSGNGDLIRTIRKDYSWDGVCTFTKEHTEDISLFSQDRTDSPVLCASVLFGKIFTMNSDSSFTQVAQLSYEDSLTCKSIVYATSTLDGGYCGIGSSDCGIYFRMYLVKFGPDGRHVPGEFGATVAAFPNPSNHGTITISFDMSSDQQVEINIYSINGILVYSGSLFAPANTHTDLPIDTELEGMFSGTYLIEARTSDAVYRNKVVVLSNR